MSRIRGDYLDYDESMTAREVYEDQSDRWSGLYDSRGQKLYRERDPVGFNPHRWTMKKGKRKGR